MYKNLSVHHAKYLISVSGIRQLTNFNKKPTNFLTHRLRLLLFSDKPNHSRVREKRAVGGGVEKKVPSLKQTFVIVTDYSPSLTIYAYGVDRTLYKRGNEFVISLNSIGRNISTNRISLRQCPVPVPIKVGGAGKFTRIFARLHRFSFKLKNVFHSKTFTSSSNNKK